MMEARICREEFVSTRRAGHITSSAERRKGDRDWPQKSTSFSTSKETQEGMTIPLILKQIHLSCFRTNVPLYGDASEAPKLLTAEVVAPIQGLPSGGKGSLAGQKKVPSSRRRNKPMNA